MFGGTRPFDRFRLDDVHADNAAKCREIPIRLVSWAYAIAAWGNAFWSKLSSIIETPTFPTDYGSGYIEHFQWHPFARQQEQIVT